MRRPLGTGIPFLMTGLSTTDTIYDLAAFPQALQERVNLITLYALVPEGDGSGEVQLDVSDGVTTIRLSDADVGDLVASQQSNQRLVKLLEKFPMRGTMTLTATTDADPVAQEVYLVGYVELEGETNPLVPLRALQPSNDLVAPYTSMPTLRSGGGAGGAITQAHLMESGRIDEITLWTRYSFIPASPHLVFSDGINSVDINLGLMWRAASPEQCGKLLDGIPIQALAAGAGIQAFTTGGTDSFTVWGTFFRR